MILLKMAFRNIMRHKRRSLFTGLMMAGAFVLFSVSLGVTEGSYSRMIDLYTRTHTGHVQIHKNGYLDRPSIYLNLESFKDIGSKIGSLPHVISWTPRLYAPALAFTGSRTTGIKITGIDPAQEAKATLIKEKVKKGRYLPDKFSHKIIITTRLARILKADINSKIAIIGQAADGSVANDIFTVSGIVQEERPLCYMHLEAAQTFMELQGRVHEIAIVLDHHSNARKSAALIEQTLKRDDMDVKPWQEVEKHFYRAMQMDKQGNWITQFVIMIIVAIGVLNSVLMTLLERTREFGILRSVGTRPYQIFLLIILETGILAFLSIIMGSAMSLFFNYLLSVYGITLPTPIQLEGLKFESYVSEITAATIYLPAAVTFLVAIAVSTVPALRAANITPVRALRTD